MKDMKERIDFAKANNIKKQSGRELNALGAKPTMTETTTDSFLACFVWAEC